MDQRNRYFRIAASVAFATAAALFFHFGLRYHLHYQEQYQLFLLTWPYFCDTVSTAGGLADYLGRFLTQFFICAPAGAAIVALLLCGVQLSCWNCFRNRNPYMYPLSFLPAILLWGFLCDEDALLTAPVALILCLLAASAVLHARGRKRQIILAAVLILLMYLACGNFFGTHYYRYVHSARALSWIAAAAAAVVIAVSYLPHKSGRSLTAGIVFGCIMAVATFLFVRHEYDAGKEEQLRYAYDVRVGDYGDIIQAASKKAPRDPLTVTALNLSLAVSDRMRDYMFHFPQNGTQGLFPLFERDHLLPLVTAEAYWQAGLVNASQRFTFEAQEAIPDFQKSAYCYQRLAKCAIANGDDAVAAKYLNALEHTMFYRRWAGHIEDTDALAKKEIRLHDTDFLFNPVDVGAMLGHLVTEHPDNRIARDYMMSWYLLGGELERFAEMYDKTVFDGLAPQAYQEAYLLQWAQTHTRFLGLPQSISEENVEKMRDVLGHYESSTYMKRHYPGSYWTYFFQQ